MSIVTKSSYKGQNTASSLTGKLRIEYDKNRIIITDGTIVFLTINQDGFKLNDGTNDRIIIGKGNFS